jgi:hypothetical protein
VQGPAFSLSLTSGKNVRWGLAHGAFGMWTQVWRTTVSIFLFEKPLSTFRQPFAILSNLPFNLSTFSTFQPFQPFQPFNLFNLFNRFQPFLFKIFSRTLRLRLPSPVPYSPREAA